MYVCLYDLISFTFVIPFYFYLMYNLSGENLRTGQTSGNLLNMTMLLKLFQNKLKFKS